MVKKAGLAALALLACFTATQAAAVTGQIARDSAEYKVTVTPFVMLAVNPTGPIVLSSNVGLANFYGNASDNPGGAASVWMYANCRYTVEAQAQSGKWPEKLFINTDTNVDFLNGTFSLGGVPATLLTDGKAKYPGTGYGKVFYFAALPHQDPTPAQGRVLDLTVELESLEGVNPPPPPGEYTATILLVIVPD